MAKSAAQLGAIAAFDLYKQPPGHRGLPDSVGARRFNGHLGSTKSAYVGGGGLVLPGTSGNYASAPDAPALDITGDIDLICKITPASWASGVVQHLIAKRGATAGTYSYRFVLGTANSLILVWSADGTAENTISSGALGNLVSPGVTKWARVAFDVDNGAAGRSAHFYLSDDGVTWALVNTATQAGVTSIFSGSSILEIGTRSGGTAEHFAGTIHRAIVKSGIGGPAVFDADFATAQDGATSVRESSTYGARLTGTSLQLPGVGNGQYALSNFTGNPASGAVLSIRTRARAVLGVTQTVIGKWTSANNQRSWAMQITSTGFIQLVRSVDGIGSAGAPSTVAAGVASGAWGYYGVDLNQATGIHTYYTSADGVTWNQLGGTVSAGGATDLYDNTQPIEIGSIANGSTQVFTGEIAYATVGYGGVVVFDANFAAQPAGAPGFIESSASGAYVNVIGGPAVVTINSSAADTNDPTYAAAGANVLRASEEFDDAVWQKFAATVLVDDEAPPAFAPATSGRAEKLIESATSAQHYVIQMGAAVAAGLAAYTTVTASVYLKAAERTHAQVLGYTMTGVTGATAVVNLATGAFIGSPSAGSLVENVGGGWYRVSLTYNVGGGGTTPGMAVFVHNGSVNNYQGDGISGVHLWGAELEQYAPAVAPYGSGTNLVTNGEDIDNAAWSKANLTVTPNSAPAPLPGATSTADKLIATAVSADHNASHTVNTVAGTTYTATAYAKAAEYSRFRLALYDGAATFASTIFDLATGTVAIAAAGAASIESIGDGWYRCRVTGTATASRTGGLPFLYPVPAGGTTTNYLGDGTSGVHVWGVQLEGHPAAPVTGYARSNARGLTFTTDDYARIDAPPTAWLSGTGLRISGTLAAASGYASIPSSAALSLAGDVDVRMAVTPKAVLTAATQYVLAKGLDWLVGLSSTGTVQLRVRRAADSAAAIGNSSVAVPTGAGQLLLARATANVTTGLFNFYTKPTTVQTAADDADSNTGWTLLGAANVNPGMSGFTVGTSATEVTVGSLGSGGSATPGEIHAVVAKNGIDGTTVLRADFAAQAAGRVSFTESSANAAAVTINGANANYPLHFDGAMTAFVVFKAAAQLSRWLLGQWDINGQRGWGMLTDGAAGTKIRALISSTGGSATKEYLSSAPIADNTPHSVCFTFGAGAFKLYVDGREDAAATKAFDGVIPSIFNSVAPVTFGCALSTGAPTGYLTGDEYAVVLLPAALTAADIAHLHQHYRTQLALDGVALPAGPPTGSAPRAMGLGIRLGI